MFERLQKPHWMLQPAIAPAPVPAPVAAPYGRALKALRLSYDAEIKDYLESCGFCVNSHPEAASIATVFKELCAMRASYTLL
jgi:hypothetical protein